MGRYVTQVFIFASVCFLVWFCSFSQVRASPVPAGAGNGINTGASPNQQTGQSENQPRPFGQKSDRQKTPKLERNRLEEGKKSAPVRKRKKKTAAKKKRKIALSSDDGASYIANKRKKVKKIKVMSPAKENDGKMKGNRREHRGRNDGAPSRSLPSSQQGAPANNALERQEL